MHELSRSLENFPSIMSCKDIASNENVLAVNGVAPKIIDYHVGSLAAIKVVVDDIRVSMPWACLPYADVMLSLFRGFFPKLFSPNALYSFLEANTERSLLAGNPSSWFTEDRLAGAHRTLVDLKEAVESMWGVKFPKLTFKFGPVIQQDFLASASAYDDMIVVHPSAPFSQYWPGIGVFTMTRLLLQKQFPKISERFKDQLAILSVRAVIGDALQSPGACFDILSHHPVDHAQYQIERISKDLNLCGDFDYKLLHMFPESSFEENYNLDMIAALVMFLIDDNLDERDLFARVSASSAGYRQFDLNFMLFQKALVYLEKIGFLKHDGENNSIIVEGDAEFKKRRSVT